MLTAEEILVLGIRILVGISVVLGLACWGTGKVYAEPSGGGGSRPSLTIGYQQSPNTAQSGFEDLDRMLRVVELGRLDAVLGSTAKMLGTALSPAFSIGWDDANLDEAIQHLTQLRLEYWWQRRAACDRKLVTGPICERAEFERTLAFIDNADEFRTEIRQTMEKAEALERSLSAGSHQPGA